MNLITAYNGINDKVALPFIERFIKYSSKHGYKFDLTVDSFKNASYKQKIISDKLKETTSDYLVWIDLDCYVVDINRKIEDIIDFKENKYIYYSKDSNGLCTGFFIIKKNEFTVKLFDMINFVGECDGKTDLISKSNMGGFLNKNGNHYDQNVVKVFLNYFPKLSDRVELIDESIIKNRDSMDSNSPFIYHFWNPWKDTDNVLRKINEFSF